jgi:hypothetical protein
MTLSQLQTTTASSKIRKRMQCKTKIVRDFGLFLRNTRLLLAVIAQPLKHWATGWTIGVLGFDSRGELGIFFTTVFRTALGSTQPPIQWVPGALSLEVKWPCREADHSAPSSAEVKECVELYLHSPIRLHGVVLS